MISSRAYETKIDLRRMCRLALKSAAPICRPGDLQYNLSDPSVDCARSIRIWEKSGEIVGFTFLHWLCEEFVFHVEPFSQRPEIEYQMIEWMRERYRQTIAEAGGWQRSLTTSVAESDYGRIAFLEKSGFTRNADYRLILDYSLDRKISAPALPAGLTARHLTGAAEATAYVTAHQDAFFLDYLDPEWRRRVLETPDYIPELDLIAVTADEEIAAFCFCWLERDEIDSSFARRGYIQSVGTVPKFQKMGVGHGLFATALQRLQTFGAQVAVGQTESDNQIARRMYASAGVRPVQRIHRYSWEPNARAERKPRTF